MQPLSVAYVILVGLPYFISCARPQDRRDEGKLIPSSADLLQEVPKDCEETLTEDDCKKCGDDWSATGDARRRLLIRPCCLMCAPEQYKEDGELVSSLAWKQPNILRTFAKTPIADKQLIMDILNFGYLPPRSEMHFQDRVPFFAMMYASHDLRDDDELVEAAVCRSSSTFQYASGRLKDDKKFVATLMANAGSIWRSYVKWSSGQRIDVSCDFDADGCGMLSKASQKLKNDEKLVKRALWGSKAECLVDILGDTLKENKEFLLEIGQNQYGEYQHQDTADAIMKLVRPSLIDKAFMRLAVKKRAWPFYKYLPDSLKEDKGFVLELFRRAPRIITYVEEGHSLWNDKAAVEEVAKKKPEMFNRASAPLKEEKDFVLELFRSTPDIITYVEEGRSLWNDKAAVEEVVEKKPEMFNRASSLLKDDKAFVLKLFRINPYIMTAGQGLWNDQAAVLEVVKKKGVKMLSRASSLKDNKAFVLKLLKAGVPGEVLKFASEKLRSDKDVVRAAIKNDPGACIHASYELKFKNEDVMLARIESNDRWDSRSYGYWEKWDRHIRDNYLLKDRKFALKAVELRHKAFVHLRGHRYERDKDIRHAVDLSAMTLKERAKHIVS